MTGSENALPEVDVRGIKQELCGYRYVPGPVLRAGVNEVIMLEVEAAPSDPTGDHTTHTCSVSNAFWQRLQYFGACSIQHRAGAISMQLILHPLSEDKFVLRPQ